MKVTFIGAAHEVTGSCSLIETMGYRFLIDYGMEQGKNVYENHELPVSPSELDLVILTHAHIDHSGNLPLLAKNGFTGPVYATNATCALLNPMLRDSAHIQEFEAEWRNRKAKRSGEDAYVPVYEMKDAELILRKLRPCKYDSVIRILENVEIRFTDIGHLLGSAAVEIWITENNVTKKIVFSGDIGSNGRPIVNDPQPIKEADYLVIESTYGNRLHEPHKDNIDLFASLIDKTLKRGGNVVIPSFAVGRTQEMLYYLRSIKEKGSVKSYPAFKVYADSPLAEEATSIFMQVEKEAVDCEAAQLMAGGINPFWFEGLVSTLTSDESKAINEDRLPKVIISASGMCEAGRIRHHLKHNLWRPESTVIFVGYQAEGTLGRALLDGAKKVKLFGEEIEVRAEIVYLPGISGHADKNGLLEWIGGFEKKPGTVFVNHGDDLSCEAFTSTLKELGYNAFAPFSGTQFDLFEGRFTVITSAVPVKETASGGGRAKAVYDDLVSQAQNLLLLAKSLKGRPNKELARFTSQIRNLIEKHK